MPCGQLSRATSVWSKLAHACNASAEAHDHMQLHTLMPRGPGHPMLVVEMRSIGVHQLIGHPVADRISALAMLYAVAGQVYLG